MQVQEPGAWYILHRSIVLLQQLETAARNCFMAGD
jgi:hypothetical protein